MNNALSLSHTQISPNHVEQSVFFPKLWTNMDQRFSISRHWIYGQLKSTCSFGPGALSATEHTLCQHVRAQPEAFLNATHSSLHFIAMYRISNKHPHLWSRIWYTN